MATVVNNPGTTESSNSGLLVGLLLVVLLFLAIWFVGLPYLRGAGGGAGTGAGTTENVQNNVQPPAAPDAGTNIQVPEQVDVNVNGGGQ